jgi:hypothetical protein
VADAKGPFARRGIKVEVETTEAAELDIVLYGMDETTVAKAGRSLANLPLMRNDMRLDGINIRAVDGVDVAFIVSRTQDASVVTIIRFWPAAERDAMVELIKGLNWLATLRGATGI